MKYKKLLSVVTFSCLLSQAIAIQAQSSAHGYFDNLLSLCGSQFVGEMTFPTEGQDSFMGKKLIADFSQCNQTQLRVPFKVGDDTSRTWVFTKTDLGLSLKHDHRHADGSPDEVTNYGGDSSGSGDAFKQSFPADDFTQTLIPAASTNVWQVSLSKDRAELTYHLERHGKPRFTAVLTKQP